MSRGVPGRSARRADRPRFLRRLCAALDTGRDLDDQLTAGVAGYQPNHYVELAGMVTSCPGQSGAILRSTMYRLLDLSEPARQVPVSPVPLPSLLDIPDGGWGQPW